MDVRYITENGVETLVITDGGSSDEDGFEYIDDIDDDIDPDEAFVYVSEDFNDLNIDACTNSIPPSVANLQTYPSYDGVLRQTRMPNKDDQYIRNVLYINDPEKNRLQISPISTTPSTVFEEKKLIIYDLIASEIGESWEDFASGVKVRINGEDFEDIDFKSFEEKVNLLFATLEHSELHNFERVYYKIILSLEVKCSRKLLSKKIQQIACMGDSITQLFCERKLRIYQLIVSEIADKWRIFGAGINISPNEMDQLQDLAISDKIYKMLDKLENKENYDLQSVYFKLIKSVEIDCRNRSLGEKIQELACMPDSKCQLFCEQKIRVYQLITSEIGDCWHKFGEGIGVEPYQLDQIVFFTYLSHRVKHMLRILEGNAFNDLQRVYLKIIKSLEDCDRKPLSERIRRIFLTYET